MSPYLWSRSPSCCLRAKETEISADLSAYCVAREGLCCLLLQCVCAERKYSSVYVLSGRGDAFQNAIGAYLLRGLISRQ